MQGIRPVRTAHLETVWLTKPETRSLDETTRTWCPRVAGSEEILHLQSYAEQAPTEGESKAQRWGWIVFRLGLREGSSGEWGCQREKWVSEGEECNRSSITPTQVTKPKLNHMNKAQVQTKPKSHLNALAKICSTHPSNKHTCNLMPRMQQPNKNHTWFTQAKHRALTAPRAGEQCRWIVFGNRAEHQNKYMF